jgi:lipoate-protein ligase A
VRLHLDRKPEGGKLLRVELELEGEVVVSAIVRGDFFAHPEELFEAAEASLAGCPAAELPARAAAAFSRPGLLLYGADAAGIAETLRRALDAHATH